MQSDIARFSERRELTMIGLAATFCGTAATSTNTLLWATAATFAAGTVNRGIAGAGFIQNAVAPGAAHSPGSWVTIVNSATLGTSFSLMERGKYLIELDGIQTAAASLIWAISMNSDMTGAAAGMTNLVAGVERSTGIMTTVAADVAPVNLSTIVSVSELQASGERVLVAANTIGTATNLTNHATIRLHCSQAAGGLPLDAEILQAQVRVKISWIGDHRGA